MVEYEIKTYHEDFIEDQVKIGTEASKGWIFQRQTPATRLKMLYSRPNFDPSTKFYAFVKDEMVGFLTSNIQEDESGTKMASFFLPLVKKGYEKAQRVLMDHALKTLQEKGVTCVTTTLGENWGNGAELLEEFGFRSTVTTFHLAEAEISKLDISNLPEPKDIVEYEKNRDSDAFISLMIDIYGVPEEYAKQRVEQYNNRAVEGLITLVAAYKDNKTIAFCAANSSDTDPKVAGISTILTKPDKDIMDLRGQFLRYLIETCADLGYEKVQFGVREVDLATRKEELSLLGLTPKPIIKAFTKEF
ncbi:MAG: hypothetical protein ACFFC7_09850 [Candidatus Hermodarchaeota archaeon]